MRKLLDKNGLIREPASKRWGLPPLDNPGREHMLKIKAWLWLMFPMIGIIISAHYFDQLTDDFGYEPWWL